MSDNTPFQSTRKVPVPPDRSRMGLSANNPEKPKVVAWAPTEGDPSRPIIAALREAGVDCWIGSRREPAGNFEVSCMASEEEKVNALILSIDPGATILTRGR